MATRTRILIVFLAVLGALPATAYAQALGIGPRMSFVRSGLAGSSPSTRFFGGTLRMRTSKRIVLEGAADFRTELNDSGTLRRRETPLQASLLIFPVRAALSPYLLGGFGMYSETLDTLNLEGGVLETSTAKTTGWHLGIGGELFVSRHAALFADYRFRFVEFGDDDEPVEAGREPINLPGLKQLSHQGSMWTSGLAFYF